MANTSEAQMKQLSAMALGPNDRGWSKIRGLTRSFVSLGPRAYHVLRADRHLRAAAEFGPYSSLPNSPRDSRKKRQVNSAGLNFVA